MARTTRLGILAPITTNVFNPLTRLLAGRLPGLGILTHVGRTSGRGHRTPVLVMRAGDDYVFGLWYGSDVHWVRNVLASRKCEIRVRGSDISLVQPELIFDPDLRLMPLPLRLAGRVVQLTEFMRMRVA